MRAQRRTDREKPRTERRAGDLEKARAEGQRDGPEKRQLQGHERRAREKRDGCRRKAKGRETYRVRSKGQRETDGPLKCRRTEETERLKRPAERYCMQERRPRRGLGAKGERRTEGAVPGRTLAQLSVCKGCTQVVLAAACLWTVAS